MKQNNSALFQSGIFFHPFDHHLIILWTRVARVYLHLVCDNRFCRYFQELDIVNFNFSLRAANSLKDPRTIPTTNVPSRSAKRVQHAGEITHAGRASSAESRVYEEDVIKIGPSEAVSIVRSESERTRIETRVFRKAPSRSRTTIVLPNFSDRVIAFRHGYFGCLI